MVVNDDGIQLLPPLMISIGGAMCWHVHLGGQWCEWNFRIFEHEPETYLVRVQTIEAQCLWRCEDYSIPAIPFASESWPVFLWNDDDSAVAVSDARIAGQFVVVACQGHCTFKMTENRLELRQRHRWDIGKFRCNGP